MKLFLSGKKFEPAGDKPSIKRAKEFLDASKDGELFTIVQLANALGVHTKALQQGVNPSEAFEGYRGGWGHGKMYYYGSPRTIAELRKQFAQTREKK